MAGVQGVTVRSESVAWRARCLNWARLDLWEGWGATPIPTRPHRSHPPVAEASVEHLAGLRNLRRLHLGRTRLTPAGRRAFREMARAHERWIVSMFGCLTKAETQQLQLLLAKLKEQLTAHSNGAAS